MLRINGREKNINIDRWEAAVRTMTRAELEERWLAGVSRRTELEQALDKLSQESGPIKSIQDRLNNQIRMNQVIRQELERRRELNKY